MAPEITSNEIRAARFRAVLRGLDRVEVEEFLSAVADRLETVEAELVKARESSVAAPADLETEFDTIGREVSAILQTAREAAEAMRERASVDAARWRTEAIAESETLRRDSAADAEALRRDAWATGTELLDQAVSNSRKVTEQAERDVLTIMGEAEREAHRLTSGARREAEDLVRNATMTAEKMTAEATRRRDEIIDTANRQASVAQERTRALEQRRDELLEELESVRATLNRLEGSLDKKLQTAETQEESTSVRLVPSPQEQSGEDPKHWEVGETVRVVQPEPRPSPRSPADQPPDPDAESLVVVKPAPVEEPEPEPEPIQEAVAPEEEAETPDQTTPDEPEAEETAAAGEPEAEVPAESEPDPEPLTPSQPETVSDTGPDPEVDSLFAALRGGAHPAEDTSEPGPVEAESESEASVERPVVPDLEGRDWIDERDGRLLAITNRALRGTKKSITELQNIALDRLRTDGAWRPDAASDAETLAADLITVWAESFAAGHAVAEEMTGSKLKRPPTPHSEAVDEFPAALSEAVATALDGAGDGQRERQSAASKVYRVWRSDEAEQRIRALAIRAYQQGIEKSVATAE